MRPDIGSGGGGGGGRPGRGTVVIHRVNPTHGIFTYGPRPGTHTRYNSFTRNNVRTSDTQVVRRKDLPDRQLDRKGSLAIGLKGGTLLSGFEDGSTYSDLGAGLMLRYRPAESVGLEIAAEHHASDWTGEFGRQQTLGSASVELFAWPWSRLSPYAIGGLTLNGRDLVDQASSDRGVERFSTGRNLIGAHAGLGLELSLGKSIAIDIEGRRVGWLTQKASDEANGGAWTATGGLVVHF